MAEFKTCTECKTEKDISEFRSRLRKKGKIYHEPKCKICSRARLNENSRKRRVNPETRKKEYVAYKQKCINDPRLGMFERSKKRAVKDKLPFDITIDDIKLVEICPILGIPLQVNYGYDNNDNSYSLDRIDCVKGYVKDNVMVVSRKANSMKSNATTEELRIFCHNILKLIGE